MTTDKILLANLFIALKAKPLAILAGPETSGKEVLVEKLVDTLSGRGKNKFQLQMLTGHLWWARGEPLAGLVEIQNRFTSEKVLSIFEEVQQPQSRDQAFLICFARISPAELQNFFTDLAFPIQNNRIMRLGDVHFTEPVTFPPNLFIIGTMDTDEYFTPGLLFLPNPAVRNGSGGLSYQFNDTILILHRPLHHACDDGVNLACVHENARAPHASVNGNEPY